MPTGQRAAVARRRAKGGRLGTSRVRTRRARAISRIRARPAGKRARMLTKALHDAGLRSWQLHGLSFGSIGLCIALWIRAKTVDQDERGNAERRALFVGLWPPMFWLIRNSLALHERRRERPRLLRR